MGSSNKFFHEIMCVVNKNGLMTSKLGRSNMPIIVKIMMIAMTETMGVIELSIILESIVDKLATTLKDKKAIKKA